MKKYILIALTGFSLNAFAGGSGWNPDEVDPSRCVMAMGSSSTSAGYIGYRMDNSVCMQGINEGKVKGVNVEGRHEFNDGSSYTFSGTVAPSSPLELKTDMQKVNKVGIKRWTYKGTWIK
ncbi:hypothetical protein KQ217_23825 (plasmid) [Escherichia coli O170:H18]|uniref:hypothetical protein n=1 Tax=Escherichia coli TaxID=562 RepID=UPI001C1F2AF4|nr:hypothetical protein [Escherichia coli]EKY6398743.1 hypothetical protein [Escherichia coli]QWV76953.1 hypothetical protein KQ217_23825 [Escherichia coli O170:H18]